ncbi:hypothetical protein JCM18909_1329 [Cutibacterium acnes JCM 18909]|nr:hypothetical protein JCM18909_1329 [Cutibacterium acnes JCM 18909]
MGGDATFVVGGATTIETLAFGGGDEGSVCHSSRLPVGWTSPWEYSRTVGIPSGAGQWAMTAGRPSFSVTTVTSAAPASLAAAATNSAPDLTSSGRWELTDRTATWRVSCSTASSKPESTLADRLLKV